MQQLHNVQSHSFASNNYSGVLPEIMVVIQTVNGGHVGAYGNDPYTEKLQQILKQQFGEQEQGFPVFNGSGANVLALQALLPRWGAVVCAQTAHINVDESVAPQWVGGFKLWTIATPDGKLSPELIAQETHGFGFEHRAQPLAVSMTQSTELGTLYTPDELRAICDFCHKNGMAVHLDGARLANAAAALGVSLREITTDVGVDIVSFVGTKNGLLLGECVVILNPERVSDGMKYLRKMNVQLASKMRFISAQLVALLENDLWLKSASNTNKMAQKLSDSLQNMDGVELVYPTQANAVFAKLPNGVADKVRELTYFYDWDEQGTVRFVCSFDTTEQHVDELVAATWAAIG
ncbi:low specificity L-threonine aldolase [Kingella kingae]|uniref:Phenylserine aldolase n=2 Tax=Kingella kingae TaxID=504 RepID=F5S9R0_KINKI|nr:low specificity L-threonine aldolase [Kingella kingae]EGK06949.1 phenylserine aldolase [Kingella kingae ATCC 23330]MDK4534585.1 low specificity L-threonine aldolase [Kingella kingae]MDK4541078.1 low specificity L-threonine aldolase [Kingella kingae]MDK4553607.1 low specificity L-threonine aldolase [Kingella kingae]UOP03091.1 low specificity L-threonine aldolase [Kingella kingae]